jgi:hypothetical protein
MKDKTLYPCQESNPSNAVRSMSLYWLIHPATYVSALYLYLHANCVCVCLSAAGYSHILRPLRATDINLSRWRCQTFLCFLHGHTVADTLNEPITTNWKFTCANWPREWLGRPIQETSCQEVLRNSVRSGRIFFLPLFIYSGLSDFKLMEVTIYRPLALSLTDK